MDLACGLGSFGADLDGPCAGLILTGGKEAHEAKGRVAGLDQLVEACLGDAQVLEEHGFFVVVKLRDLRLDAGADDKDTAVGLGRVLTDLLHTFIVSAVVGKVVFRDVCRINDGLVGQKVVGLQPFFLILGQAVRRQKGGGLSSLEVLAHSLEELHLFAGFLIHLGRAGDLGDTALQHFEVRKDQLQIDGLNIAKRVNTSVDMDDILILKAAHYMDDGVNLTDICQELVAQALTLGCALDKSCDIHELDHGGCHLFRVIHLTQKTDPLIRYRYHADIGVDGAEWIVCCLCAGLGQRIKKCALAYIRKSDNA